MHGEFDVFGCDGFEGHFPSSGPECLAAALARRTRQALFLALERFKEEGFIRFSIAHQARRRLLIGQREKTMASAEGRVAMHVARDGAFANAFAVGDLLRIDRPLGLVEQSGQYIAPRDAHDFAVSVLRQRGLDQEQAWKVSSLAFDASRPQKFATRKGLPKVAD